MDAESVAEYWRFVEGLRQKKDPFSYPKMNLPGEQVNKTASKQKKSNMKMWCRIINSKTHFTAWLRRLMHWITYLFSILSSCLCPRCVRNPLLLFDQIPDSLLFPALHTVLPVLWLISMVDASYERVTFQSVRHCQMACPWTTLYIFPFLLFDRRHLECHGVWLESIHHLYYCIWKCKNMSAIFKILYLWK